MWYQDDIEKTMRTFLLESSMSRFLRKTMEYDIAILTAFRGFSEDGDNYKNRIVFGKDSDSKGRRPILFPLYLEGKWAKSIQEANNIANSLMLKELEDIGLFVKKESGATSVLGAYHEAGNAKPTVENSFVIENKKNIDSGSFLKRVLLIASKYNQDSISFLPKVTSMKNSYLFITSGAQDKDGSFKINGAYLGKLKTIGRKDMTDHSEGKTVIGNKQIEYDVDWSKEYTPAMMVNFINRVNKGEDEDYEELVNAEKKDDMLREKSFMRFKTNHGYKMSAKDRERAAVIDDVLKNL